MKEGMDIGIGKPFKKWPGETLVDKAGMVVQTKEALRSLDQAVEADKEFKADEQKKKEQALHIEELNKEIEKAKLQEAKVVAVAGKVRELDQSIKDAKQTLSKDILDDEQAYKKIFGKEEIQLVELQKELVGESKVLIGIKNIIDQDPDVAGLMKRKAEEFKAEHKNPSTVYALNGQSTVIYTSMDKRADEQYGNSITNYSIKEYLYNNLSEEEKKKAPADLLDGYLDLAITEARQVFNTSEARGKSNTLERLIEVSKKSELTLDKLSTEYQQLSLFKGKKFNVRYDESNAKASFELDGQTPLHEKENGLKGSGVLINMDLFSYLGQVINRDNNTIKEFEADAKTFLGIKNAASKILLEAQKNKETIEFLKGQVSKFIDCEREISLLLREFLNTNKIEGDKKSNTEFLNKIKVKTSSGVLVDFQSMSEFFNNIRSALQETIVERKSSVLNITETEQKELSSFKENRDKLEELYQKLSAAMQ